MIYVQFFQPSALDNTELVEACGDRSVVILDGRSPERHHGWARQECMERGYVAWQLMTGESFTRSRPLTAAKRV